MTESMPTAQLSSYEPAQIHLGAEVQKMSAPELEGYKRALTAIELAKRVTGVMDPAIYEQAAMGIRSQAEAQAKAAGTTLMQTMRENNIPSAQYDRMVSMQAMDMVNQGLALDAWAMHFQIEPTEEDVMELLSQMAPGGERDLLERASQDPAQLQALGTAALRYSANKHAASVAVVD
ncbi:MAG: hypothetical protein Q4D06_04825 [Coriobacteriia bacterium]|nr:hypothetical protein [Coriobacteriia bacterium]